MVIGISFEAIQYMQVLWRMIIHQNGSIRVIITGDGNFFGSIPSPAAILYYVVKMFTAAVDRKSSFPDLSPKFQPANAHERGPRERFSKNLRSKIEPFG